VRDDDPPPEAESGLQRSGQLLEPGRVQGLQLIRHRHADVGALPTRLKLPQAEPECQIDSGAHAAG
jgi:hypothetical protein